MDLIWRLSLPVVKRLRTTVLTDYCYESVGTEMPSLLLATKGRQKWKPRLHLNLAVIVGFDLCGYTTKGPDIVSMLPCNIFQENRIT